MGFRSQNEIDKFAYNDCVVTDVHMTDEELIIKLEALIVKANNSQNSNFTDSYAGEAECVISGFKYHKLSKIGFKYYDADDKLVEEIPDKELDIEVTDICELMKDMYLYKVEKLDDKDIFHLEIETMEEDVSIPTDSYELTFSASDITISWDRYMNRVQS